MAAKWSKEEDKELEERFHRGESTKTIAEQMNRTKDSVSGRLRRIGLYVQSVAPKDDVPATDVYEVRGDGSSVCRIHTDHPIKTVDELLKVCKIDTKRYEVTRVLCKAWTTPMKVRQGQDRSSGHQLPDTPITTQQYLVTAWLKPLEPQIRATADLLDALQKHSFKLPAYIRPRHTTKSTKNRALEISVMDPHMGLRCHKPQSDATWSLQECKNAFMDTVEELLSLAEKEGPYTEVVSPIGNDYLHADTVFHETTQGTLQPEMESIHEVYQQALELLLWYTERLRKVAPVRLYHIPGNHDRWSSFTLAHVVKAFYQGAKAKDVTVEVEPSPYKFWRYGVNLIGFEHGHSVNAIRLAALMANETRLSGWSNARYCEWHLGDQHRKGSSKPSSFEEQGVSVEYLPGLTPPNEWHRLKAFNWQKRGAMAFVYDKDCGPVARFQINFDNYSGRRMGT